MSSKNTLTETQNKCLINYLGTLWPIKFSHKINHHHKWNISVLYMYYWILFHLWLQHDLAWHCSCPLNVPYLAQYPLKESTTEYQTLFLQCLSYAINKVKLNTCVLNWYYDGSQLMWESKIFPSCYQPHKFNNNLEYPFSFWMFQPTLCNYLIISTRFANEWSLVIFFYFLRI